MTTTNIYDMADTWTAGGTTYTAIKMNVTDTASAAASLLMDLQVGGTSKFNVSKAGVLTFAGDGTTWSFNGNLATGYLAMGNTGNVRMAINWSDEISLASSHALCWTSGGNALQTPDLKLWRDAANVFAQRNSTNAQTFRIYNTYTDGSNYERANFRWGSNTLFIETEGAGTGSNSRSIELSGESIRFSDENETLKWLVTGDGHFLAGTDNTYDIGASGDTRPRTIYAGTSVVAAGVNLNVETLVISVSDETTAITTGTAKVTFRMPWAMTLTAVRASLSAASSSGTPTIDINEGGSTILSTKLTIDANEKTSTTAATPAVISDSALADDAEITIDIDTAGTDAKGLKVYLIGTRL